MNDKEKRIIEKSNNTDTPEDFEYDILKKRFSRKWQLINQIKSVAIVVTLFFCFMLIYEADAVKETSSVWTVLLPLLWTGPVGYAAGGKIVEGIKDK